MTAEPNFTAMHDRMQFYVDQEILPCCATVVFRGTEIIDQKTFGFMDLESREPLRSDAIFRMKSNTKLITSVALMMLYEQGLFDLDDPLPKYLPEFSDMSVLSEGATSLADCVPAEGFITPRQLLCHSAGLSYGFIEPTSLIDQAYAQAGINLLEDENLDLDELCARVAGLPLVYEPGTAWRYSVATDVCARLLEVLTGQPFDRVLREQIFEPLGMVDTDFWVSPDRAHRLTTHYGPTNLLDPMASGLVKTDDPIAGHFNQPRKLLSGGGGLVSTVADYSQFLRMLVNEGEWAGVRLLKPQTLELMRTNQLAPGVGVEFLNWQMPGTVFGLGFAIKAALADHEPPASLNEYHWGGLSGTHSWVAPEANLTGFCLTQRMPGFLHPFSQDFKSMVYEIASE